MQKEIRYTGTGFGTAMGTVLDRNWNGAVRALDQVMHEEMIATYFHQK